MEKQAKDMEKDYVRKDLKLCFLKFLLLCSLMSLWIQDVSPTGNLDCEISAQKCQPPLETKTRTVTPKDSRVTFNCSIKNGGKVQDMTWQDLERNLSANNGLFLHQNNSKDKNRSRECFSIKFAIPVQGIYRTSSPLDYFPDTREMELKCTFKGWPRPRVVWYNPDKKQIINGSEGFYISEQLVGEDTLTSLLRNPDIQEKQAGAYKCIGMNNITGWSTKNSVIIQLYYRCLWPKAPQISSPAVSVTAYSNVSLKCLVSVRPSDCWDNSLQWYFNSSSVKLKSGEKYDIQERTTNTKCKKDFILTIVNVTEADEGKYKCQWLCENDYPSFYRSSIIQLKVYPPEEDFSTPSSQKTSSSTSTVATTGQGNSKSADKWIPAITILTSGLALFLILFSAYHLISKKFGTGYHACKRKMTSNHLSSKGNH
ncbi:uncharacterized protein [Porites lutea]|uniref:uncharacterized protein n=1 Tax=Porites lutea TaxID=51062 RepID=UPI003CC61177